MAQQTLFDFLTRSEIPHIPIRSDAEKTKNTRNTAYPLRSAVPILWTGFSYGIIMQSRYATILFNINNVEKDPLNSPAKAVKGEPSVQAALVEYVIKRIRRALGKTTFPPHHTTMLMGTGDLASLGTLGTSDAKPDFVGYPNKPDPEARLPGDVKCSWKWHSSWATSLEKGKRNEFRAVVAQINFYMNQAGSRYGYILTDAELVLFRKLDNEYAMHIEYSPGIPLTRHDSTGVFTPHDGQLTALLALWYVHMLASDTRTWQVQNIMSDPEEDTDGSGNFV